MMKAFGINEYGNKDGFKIVCCRCGKEAREYKNPEKITLELRCTCGNKYGATIHSDK